MDVKSKRKKEVPEFIMSPKVDFCFKELMEDEEVRCGFIAALLQVRPADILHTTLLPTHLRKKHPHDKLGILDVRIVLFDGTQLDMEMQLISYDYWTERSLFYLGKMYVDQIHEGDDYEQLKKCIHVGILDFILFDHKDYYSRFHIWEDTKHILYSDKLEIHILELPKLSQYNYPDSELLQWAHFFNAKRKDEMEMIAKSDKYVGKAYEKLIHLSEDEEKRLEYEARQKAIRDYNHMINSGIRQGYKAGHEDGIQEAYVQGVRIFIETLTEMNFKKPDILSQLAEKYSLSNEEADALFRKITG